MDETPNEAITHCEGMNMASRLEILEASLAKKTSLVDSKIQNHFDTVRSANGQPLNDKRNGSATLQQWERQNNGIRSALKGVEITENAIEREKATVARIEGTNIHPILSKMVQQEELIQWRKFPNTFFVPGVDKGRIVWDDDKQVLCHRYLRDVPKEQYGIFRDTFNKANAGIRAS